MLDRFDKFMCNITEIDLYLHRISTTVMKKYDLKGNYAIYFTKLHGMKEGITAANLAVACGKDKADVSRDIAVLEKGGFVERVRTGNTAYRARIMLTENGRDVARKVITAAIRAVDFVGHDYNIDDLNTFYKLLEVIKNNLHELSESGIPEKKPRKTKKED